MKKFTIALALALLLTAFAGTAPAGDKKLSRADFSLAPRLERVEGDVAELKDRVAKLERLIADKAKKADLVASDVPSRPEGEGWQYNAAEKSWWRYVTPQTAPQSYVLPAGGYIQGGYTQGGCPNGRCPLPR